MASVLKEDQLKTVLFASALFVSAMLLSTLSFADVTITSQFGYSADLPDGWFVISPQKIAKANKNETAQSLGLSDSADPAVLDEILNRVKGGNIEFYYDNKYINTSFKNHVSAQIGPPLRFSSMQEVSEQCTALPAELNQLFGEPVTLISCQLFNAGGWPVFHHAYTVESQSLTIINETVHVNEDYSMIFVGGSGNDIAGLHRVRAAQQSLIEAITTYLKLQSIDN